MKYLMLLIAEVSLCGILICSNTIAGPNNTSEKLNTALKSLQTITPKANKNDITIVYGGEDISNRPTITTHTTLA